MSVVIFSYYFYNLVDIENIIVCFLQTFAAHWQIWFVICCQLWDVFYWTDFKISDMFSRWRSASFISALLVAESKMVIHSHGYLWTRISENSKISMCTTCYPVQYLIDFGSSSIVIAKKDKCKVLALNFSEHPKMLKGVFAHKDSLILAHTLPGGRNLKKYKLKKTWLYLWWLLNYVPWPKLVS